MFFLWNKLFLLKIKLLLYLWLLFIFKESKKAPLIGSKIENVDVLDFEKQPDGSLSRSNTREFKNDFYL